MVFFFDLWNVIDVIVIVVVFLIFVFWHLRLNKDVYLFAVFVLFSRCEDVAQYGCLV